MESDNIELREYWVILRKRIWLVISIPILAALVSAMASLFFIKPTYQMNTTLLINSQQGANVSNPGLQYQTILTSQALVNTYSDLIKSNTVESQVISQLHLPYSVEQLDSMIQVSSPNQSQVIEISVKGHNAELAANVANTLSQAFQQEAQNIMSVQNVQVIDPAVVPHTLVAISPNKKLNVAIAFVLGLMVSAGLAFLLEYLDYRLKDEGEVQRYLELPVLGMIYDFSKELR